MINFPLELLENAPITLDDTAKERLNVYGNLLIEWNEKMNLTAITEPKAVVIKHFLDCLTFFSAVDLPQNAKIIDVGTGAGFPGMVLKIARPDLKVTLLDSLNKRLVFLNEVNEKTGLDCEIIHARAEDGGKNQALREKFDFACARAVAPLNVLLEYCTPFVKVGGMFVAMKGPAAEEEIKAARNAEKLLNVKLDNKTHLTLEGNDERFIVSYKKISQTPPKFPRISGKISKTPL